MQLSQTCHALAQFAIEHNETFKQWNNNYIVCLSIDDENQLGNLLAKLEAQGINVSAFYEPDLNFQLTAIAIEGTEKASKLVSSLPLAFKAPKQELLTVNQ